MKHYYILFLALICGALVMILEFVGTRVLAPYYGTGLYVWSALISVTLVSLAMGYFLGGFVADKRPDENILYWALGLTGLIIVLLPIFSGPIIRTCSLLEIRIGSIISAALLLMLPLLVLGAVIPFAVRIRAKEISTVGITSGMIYALSTLGSVLGTLVAAYILIPNLGLERIFCLVGVVLFALAGLGWLINKKHIKFIVCALLFILILLWGNKISSLHGAQRTSGLLYQSESFYGHLEVIETDRSLILSVDGVPQTIVPKGFLEDPKTDTYPSYIWLMPFYNPKGKDLLVIGLGGGLHTMMFKAQGLKVESVEINPQVKDAAEKYFGFQGDVVIDDGRHFLQGSKKRYDFIIIDAFSGENPPFHLFTQEMFEIIRSHLRKGGIFAMNYIGPLYGKDSLVTWSIYRTMQTSFNEIHVYQAPLTENLFNITFFASVDLLKLDEERILKEVPGMNYVGIYELKEVRMKEPLGIGTVITDNYNPIELWWVSTGMRWRKVTSEFLGK